MELPELPEFNPKNRPEVNKSGPKKPAKFWIFRSFGYFDATPTPKRTPKPFVGVRFGVLRFARKVRQILDLSIIWLFRRHANTKTDAKTIRWRPFWCPSLRSQSTSNFGSFNLLVISMFYPCRCFVC
jgi:hypothetical protein